MEMAAEDAGENFWEAVAGSAVVEETNDVAVFIGSRNVFIGRDHAPAPAKALLFDSMY